jgi:hypothetical protein
MGSLQREIIIHPGNGAYIDYNFSQSTTLFMIISE